MQLIASTPVVARARAGPSRARQVVCQAAPETAGTSRREFAAALFSAPLLVASPAFALLVDDEDLELLEKAKAARKAKLQQERATEREFVVAGSKKGNVAGKLGAEIAALQVAINTLSKSGALIEGGKIKEVSELVKSDSSWVSNLKKTTVEVGGTEETKAFASEFFGNLAKLEKSSGAGNAKSAKADYVSAVEALETWAALAGFSNSVKGL